MSITGILCASGLRGLYAGFSPAVLGSTLSWGLYFFLWVLAQHFFQLVAFTFNNFIHHFIEIIFLSFFLCICKLWQSQTEILKEWGAEAEPWSSSSFCCWSRSFGECLNFHCNHLKGNWNISHWISVNINNVNIRRLCRKELWQKERKE